MDNNVYIYQYIQYIISQLEQKNCEIVSLSREFEQVEYQINDLFFNGNPVRYHTDTKLRAALEEYHEIEQKAIFAFKQVDKFSEKHVSLLAHWEPEQSYSNVMLEYSGEVPKDQWVVTLTRENESFIDEGIREYFEQYQDAHDFFCRTLKTYQRGKDEDNNPRPELTEEFISGFASMGDYRFYHYQRLPGEKTEEKGQRTSNYYYLGLWISVVRHVSDNKFVRSFYP